MTTEPGPERELREGLMRQEGLEPSTYGLEGRCSIHLSYWRLFPGIGAARFELATPWSQTRCATGLRHAPNYDRRER